MKKTLLMTGLLMLGMLSPLLAQTTSPGAYCDGSFDDAGSFLVPDQINEVSLGILSNTSDTQSPAPHYIYYDNLTAPILKIDSSYTLSVVFEVHGGAGYGVWIDFNKDNQFSASEKISGTTSSTWLALNSPDTTLITHSITIPSTADTGITRMRVRIVEDDMYTMSNGGDILPCNASNSAADIMDWGETEDYNVHITSVVPDNDTTNGIQQVVANEIVSVYPNPVHSVLKINTDLTGQFDYSIYNLTGKRISNGKLSEGHSLIDVSVLEEGIYFVRFSQSGIGLGQHKFIKINY